MGILAHIRLRGSARTFCSLAAPTLWLPLPRIIRASCTANVFEFVANDLGEGVGGGAIGATQGYHGHDVNCGDSVSLDWLASKLWFNTNLPSNRNRDSVHIGQDLFIGKANYLPSH